MFGFREAAKQLSGGAKQQRRGAAAAQRRSGLLVLLFVAADAVGEHRDDLMQVANDA